ncbi:unnamed protein product [Timema podura]|uniref:Uncharacterized protein n=1 Tax=Timema podura TaxID=61482 RepID=A0ABN7P8G1_TIMPD|nr:unnamed protein product [Timema podura]
MEWASFTCKTGAFHSGLGRCHPVFSIVPHLRHTMSDYETGSRSVATLFLYAPEIFWSSHTIERKWIRCVLVTALRSGPAQPYLPII